LPKNSDERRSFDILNEKGEKKAVLEINVLYEREGVGM
jgi:hypothetical protein